MKKFYAFTCCLLVSAVMLAQPTLDYPQNAPEVGDAMYIQFVVPNGMSPDPSGAGVLWDWSILQPSHGGLITAIDPSEAPAGGDFPLSNVVMSMGDTIFTYALTNADGYFYLGSQSTTGTFPSLLQYSNYRTFVKFPFTYEDTNSDTFKGVVTTTVASIHVNATSETFADAYGTLNIPSGIYNNVLRTVTVDAEIDSVFVGGNFVKAFNIDRTQYLWYGEDSKGPIMSMEIVSNAYYGTMDTVIYYTTSGAGIGDIYDNQISQLRIFPNPAEDHIMVAFETSPNAESTVSMVNQVGQVVIQKVVFGDNNGQVNEGFDISHLPSGIYFVNISCNCGNQITQKFVIR